MKTIFSLLIVAFLFTSSGEAQQQLSTLRKPVKTEITFLSDKDKMTGALFDLKDSSILVSNSYKKEDYFIGNYNIAELYIDEIDILKSRKNINTLGGAAIGVAIGLGSGLIIGRIIEGPRPVSSGGSFFPADFLYGLETMFFGCIGAGIGAIGGGIIGSIKLEIPINGSIDSYTRHKQKLKRYTIIY